MDGSSPEEVLEWAQKALDLADELPGSEFLLKKKRCLDDLDGE